MKNKPKVKTKKTPEENFDFMKTNKDNLKNIVKNQETINIINELAIKTNKIVIHAYNFIKLYCLYLYKENKPLPTFDKDYISDVFKVITIRKCRTGGYRDDNMPEQLDTLTKFYKEHYKSSVDVNEKLYYDKLSYILAYEAIDVTTNITNNIRGHYLDHLNKFVNITFNVKDKMAQITKDNKDKEIRKQKKKELYNEFKKVKDDLISINKNKTSDNKYHIWIDEIRKNVLPNKSKFDKDNVLYDIKSKTFDYLKPMIYLGIELEKIYDAEKDYHKTRLFNILPLRTNIIVKNIVIDTCGLIQNFLGDESTTKILQNYKKDDTQKKLWERFFKIDKRVFKKNKYSFHYMIRSDGISSSILFIRNDINGEPMKKKPSEIIKEDDMTEYIEKVKLTEEMKNKKIVCADPGMSDLLYFGSKNNDGNLETFRYTQNQRRLETRFKKYSKIINTINNETKINDESIKQLESKLSIYNSKTNNYDKFKKYVIEKNKLNITLFSHYEQELFRKFKLNRFINTQKSESKMIKNFENKFGKPKDVIFVMGDYDKGDHNMKGVEPVICKKFRRIFKNAGYENYLVNEFRTSKLCNHCHNELEKFMEVKSHKPRDIKDNKKVISNGLLRCQSLMPVCEIIHNRDKNAVQNMLFIVEIIKTTGERPIEFSRETV